MEAKKLSIRDGEQGKTYLTLQGLKIRFLRNRSDADDSVVESLASGGHELVIPGGTEVTEDVSADQVIVAADQKTTGRHRLALLMQCIVKESDMAVEEISDITSFPKEAVQGELNILLASV